MSAPLNMELRRMAVELQTFPFEPRKLVKTMKGRAGVRIPGGRINVSINGATPGKWGAKVYYDIVNYGGSGTRREVLREIEQILVMQPAWVDPASPDPADSTKLAAYTVALLRQAGDFSKISEPELPAEVAHYWQVKSGHDEPLKATVEVLGDQLSAELRSREGAWAVDMLNMEEHWVVRARDLWHQAQVATGDDYGAWLAEKQEMHATLKALGAAMFERLGSLHNTATRRINLDED